MYFFFFLKKITQGEKHSRVLVEVPQVNCMKCTRLNHPNAEKLLSDKQREWKLGQLGRKKKRETVTGTFTEVKRKGRAEKEKQPAGDVRGAEKPFCLHVRGRQGKNWSATRWAGKAPKRGHKVKRLMPFLCLYKKPDCSGSRQEWHSCGNRDETGQSSEELHKFVIPTLPEPDTIQPRLFQAGLSNLRAADSCLQEHLDEE